MSNFSVQITNLHFDYNENTKVFEDHSLDLVVPKDQTNKLYGIIGPSGAGKTTLLSMLGGQLKPTSGSIKIDQTDIYTVDDLVRRDLISLQMQTATSLRGKLRYNMLFGLPQTYIEDALEKETVEKQLYPDEYLIEILRNVGLWNLFKEKDGLETLIGEGGLNLSGGQRQRLNFAGLYLRTKYFQPHLVLIDEPTSSLDEISEKAITKMILEMAQKAVTIVIAHRLKTLDDSVGILDFSLINQEKEMKFYTKPELMTKSDYYEKLINGELQLDD